MKRLFAAVHIGPDPVFIREFRVLKSGLAFESIKWVEEHNFHITLKFFGETHESKIPLIKELLSETASATDVMHLSLSGLGIFGSRYEPRVIWTAVAPPDPLARLMKTVQQKVIPLGFEADRQNIVPHLTLARIRKLNDKHYFQKILSEKKGIRSSDIQISECVLFESLLGPQGPKYIPLEKFPFRS